MLKDKKITLYVTGSIAIYKSLILARLLIKNGNEVKVVMTEDAQKFISPLTFQALTKNEVLTDVFVENDPKSISHIKTADDTDVAIIAPATANIIAKMANGIADDMASTTLLATQAPKFVIPSMNTHMLDNPATVRNLQQLSDDGITIMETANGLLAEGYTGKGRFPEPEEILNWLDSFFEAPLAGKNIVVTAGGTKERIDPVRYISNDSSGKMGIAIARAAQNAGANVTLVVGSVSVKLPSGVKILKIESSTELLEETQKAFSSADALIMSAAVADFRPKRVVDHKIKKTADNDNLSIELVKNPDILKTLGSNKQDNQVMIGFAAETNDLIENAVKKIKNKNLDLIVANDVSDKRIGFNSNDNQVTYIFKDGKQVKSELASKDIIAKQIVDIMSQLLN